MSFELSFGPEFFFAEGEPYDRGPYTAEEIAKPTSVWMAIENMDVEQRYDVAKDCFGCMPQHLTSETVMDRIRETDTCRDLRSPVEVYIDESRIHSIEVWEKPDD